MRVGDTVEIRLTNARFAQNMHSIDLHAVTGPGGGAAVTQIRPGEAGAFEPDWTPSCPGCPSRVPSCGRRSPAW